MMRSTIMIFWMFTIAAVFTIVDKPPKCDIIQERVMTKEETKNYKKNYKKNHEKIVGIVVKAYCPCKKCCGAYADGTTATGHTIKQPIDRFVASNKLKFGTLVLIPGYNNNEPVLVLDRGPNLVEVFFNKHQDAVDWGAPMKEVKIYEAPTLRH